MDKLKSFFEQNRGAFDTEEPAFGHFERFQQKLEVEHKKQRKINYRVVLQVAASVAILAIACVAVFSVLFGKGMETIKDEVAELNIKTGSEFVQQTTQTVKSKFNAEYRETQQYFIFEVDNRLDQIRANDNMDEEQKAELLKELSEMDEVFAELQEELKKAPDNQILIDAMIKHYKMKIEVMNQIINNLNNIKNLNTQSNEKVDL